MHELKTIGIGRVAGKTDEEEECSKSICEAELGQSVLTLGEVI